MAVQSLKISYCDHIQLQIFSILFKTNKMFLRVLIKI